MECCCGTPDLRTPSPVAVSVHRRAKSGKMLKHICDNTEGSDLLPQGFCLGLRVGIDMQDLRTQEVLLKRQIEKAIIWGKLQVHFCVSSHFCL